MQENQTSIIPPQYYQIEKVVNTFKNVICEKFRTHQARLIIELQQKAKQLRDNIAYYKKQTSNENLQKLINKKRHQKEAQRLELQVHWRNLTEKYKKLQQEQKKINQQNRESKFDVQNLQSKISQLRHQNIALDNKILSLRSQAPINKFLTQPSHQYNSPYSIAQCSFIQSKPSILIQPQYISSFQKKKQSQSNQFKVFSQQNKHLNQNKKLRSKQCENNRRITGDKWKQLKDYINRQNVRDRIFQILRN